MICTQRDYYLIISNLKNYLENVIRSFDKHLLNYMRERTDNSKRKTSRIANRDARSHRIDERKKLVALFFPLRRLIMQKRMDSLLNMFDHAILIRLVFN